ncbi:MAG: DUF3817 domain-containing protein [Gemmatimonadaceae bacterium]|nr:DUF3817 domain-containing protein [Chitinophagaceae bacterium]
MTTLRQFRIIAVTEGVSYLLLVFIAMPLKYFAQIPEPVKYLGWLHGLLFVLFCLWLCLCWIKYRWKFGFVVLAFIASLLPFGTFFLDKRLRREPAKS